ncbi:MAG: hypothetical protein ACYCU7_18630 [Acidimicrobiales bacterium]
MTELRAWHGDPGLKTRTVAEMQAHADADQIIQGQYWEGGKGCAVGCMTHDQAGGHKRYPVRWGIPVVLAYLEDELFELSPQAEARKWPVRFLSAIPVGADLTGVWDRWCVWMLTDPTWGVANVADPDGVVSAMGVLFARRVAGEQPTKDEWADAAWAAWAARAAEAARGAWAAEAAWDAEAARGAWAARAAARGAWAARDAEAARGAWAARAAWDAEAARGAWAAEAARGAEAAGAAWTPAACDELIRLLESAPVITEEDP